ncbi:MAG: response regulator transcription factor [Flavobacteriaceae bacterium]|nr:response regulator transcription factor [Flavobacteriaceae bacterium]
MIKVFIVDDHKMVIEGIQLLLKGKDHIKVVGTALSGDEAISSIPSFDVDVLLLDINMPGKNGIETCKELLKIKPDLKVIAITMHKESSLIKLMLSHGAKGYILKNAGQAEIIEAIEAVNNNKLYLDDTVNEIVVNSVVHKNGNKSNSPFPTLSRREKEVLQCILDEFTTQEIADKLHISFGTVETHRRNMLIKTGARNTAGLVRIALEYELNQ